MVSGLDTGPRLTGGRTEIQEAAVSVTKVLTMNLSLHNQTSYQAVGSIKRVPAVRARALRGARSSRSLALPVALPSAGAGNSRARSQEMLPPPAANPRFKTTTPKLFRASL